MKAILIFLISTNLYAFTLSDSKGRSFPNNEIDVHIAPTACTGAGFSTSKLKSMVKTAVKDYWNAVPSSAIKLNVTGIKASMDIDGYQHQQAINNVVPKNEIVAGCNDDVTEFSNPAILGAAVMDCNNSSCKAVLILNANNSNLRTKSSSEVEAVIAHELGHAVGLGHTEIKHNLMYFSTGGKTQKWLGQDDIDGITYLYPHDESLSCLLGSFGGTVTFNHETTKKYWTNFLFAFSMVMSLFFMFKLLGIYNRKFFPVKLN